MQRPRDVNGIGLSISCADQCLYRHKIEYDGDFFWFRQNYVPKRNIVQMMMTNKKSIKKKKTNCRNVGYDMFCWERDKYSLSNWPTANKHKYIGTIFKIDTDHHIILFK